MNLLLLTGCFLTVAKLCSGDFTVYPFSKVSHMSDKVCPDNLKIFTEIVRSVFICAMLCLTRSVCDGIGFNNGTKTCYGCKSFNRIPGCGPPSQYLPLTGTTNFMKPGHLISGVFLVLNEGLSSLCSYPPPPEGPADLYSVKYARLCKIETIFGNAAFSGCNYVQNQWVQAKFQQRAVVLKIEVQPRISNIPPQYVTKYIFKTSDNCIDFITYTDKETGNTTIFDGVVGPYTGGVATLPYPVSTLCARIYPTEWVTWMSLRFDLIGYYA